MTAVCHTIRDDSRQLITAARLNVGFLLSYLTVGSFASLNGLGLVGGLTKKYTGNGLLGH